MKRKLRFVLMIAVAFAIGIPFARATEEKEETLGDKLKKLFVRPTPTPKARKKKKTSPAATHSPSPSATAIASPSETPISSATPSETPGESPTTIPETPAEKSPTQYFEAVRPITPHGRPKRSPIMKAAPAKQSTPLATMTPASELPSEPSAERPRPSLPPMTSPPSAPIKTPETSATPASTPTPMAIKTPATAISLDEISDSSNYSAEVRKIVDLGLGLTARNLSYKYASADPAKGGMDCSGFIYYVLTQSGIKDVPRDAREQYIWVRKAGNFQAVLAQRDDTFELDGLKPGDLLFWASNYGISRDPDITQTMIYLGREKGTNQRLMVGASENRSSRGPKRAGVGIFEFKVARSAPKPNQENGPVFVGYGRIPGSEGK